MRDYASLYSDLLADLGCDDSIHGPITSDMTKNLVARQSLALSFFKKLVPSGNSRIADMNALEKFKTINSSLPLIYSFGETNEAESCFWDYLKDNLNRALGPHIEEGSYDLDSIREEMMPGPGAAQKADSTTFVSKLFEGKMSYTDGRLIPYYRAALSETGLWADAEKRRFESFGFDKVSGGKLFFAPKNAEISRTCCTEANLNLLIQRSVGAFIEKRLKLHFGISLETQPDYNRELARRGSEDQSFGTIDLVSASDSIGLDMLKQILDPSLLKTMILMSRSEFAVLPDGTSVNLRMVSTMGNGFTFPLQTIIFASAVRAVYQLMGFPSHCPRTQFGVFGDDIVVRREAYDFICRMLTKLGFQVNVGKSFNSGAFRESCGHDYYLGHNVRGVYVRSLEIPQQVYSLINRLNRWSTFHGILLCKTVKRLLSWVRDIRIPPSEADDAGIHVPFKATKPSVNNSYWFQYRCYKRRISRFTYAELDHPTSAPFNPEGVGVGVLSGSIRRRDVSITKSDSTAWSTDWALSATLRDRVGSRPRYQIVKSSIPYWDYIRTDRIADGRPAVRRADHKFFSPFEFRVKGLSRDSVRDDAWRIGLTTDRYRAWESVVLATLAMS
jgi:hypothetical protein